MTETNPAPGLPALYALRAELRARKANRDDDRLLRLAGDCGIFVHQVTDRRVDVMACTYTNRIVTNMFGDVCRSHPLHGKVVDRVFAMASDRNPRSAIRRLLSVHESEVLRAALTQPQTVALFYIDGRVPN